MRSRWASKAYKAILVNEVQNIDSNDSQKQQGTPFQMLCHTPLRSEVVRCSEKGGSIFHMRVPELHLGEVNTEDYVYHITMHVSWPTVHGHEALCLIQVWSNIEYDAPPFVISAFLFYDFQLKFHSLRKYQSQWHWKSLQTCGAPQSFWMISPWSILDSAKESWTATALVKYQLPSDPHVDFGDNSSLINHWTAIQKLYHRAVA